MNRISNLVLASLMLSAAPLVANATAYIQNQMTDQSLTVQYQYCKTTSYPYKCSETITATDIKPQTAYTVPNASGPVKFDLIQILSASTPDGWTYAGPQGTCSPSINLAPDFANFTKSFVPNVLQCTHSVGAAK